MRKPWGLGLCAFEEKWDNQFPSIAKSWHDNRDNLNTLFEYPQKIRRAVRHRKIFPDDKAVYLAIEEVSEKWTMPVRNWQAAMNRFLIMFPERFGS